MAGFIRVLNYLYSRHRINIQENMGLCDVTLMIIRVINATEHYWMGILKAFKWSTKFVNTNMQGE